jgi:hypothetical protein
MERGVDRGDCMKAAVFEEPHSPQFKGTKRELEISSFEDLLG